MGERRVVLRLPITPVYPQSSYGYALNIKYIHNQIINNQTTNMKQKQILLFAILLMASILQAQDFELIEPIKETEPMNELQVSRYLNSTRFNNWGITRLGLDTAMTKYTGKNIKICICDTGRPEHPSLQSHITGSENFTTDATDIDGNGHSTHVGGIIAEIAPDAPLLFAKVLTDRGSGSSQGVANGILWCVNRGASIINLSLGGSFPNTIMKQAIDTAYAKGVIVIAAAGNDGQSATEEKIGYPARYPETIAVGSINNLLAVSTFSSAGEFGDVMAPGEKVLSTYLGNKYIVLSGTSMATPYVSAMTALHLQRTQMHVNVQNILRNTSTDMMQHGYDRYSFYGHVTPSKLFNDPPPNDEEPEPEDPTGGIKIPDWFKEQYPTIAMAASILIMIIIALWKRFKK